MSTRRNADLRFDHGAQYFTARDPRFLRHVVAWQERGLVAACDALVVTTPPGQARILLADPEVDDLIGGVEMMPCWALMLVLDKPLFADHNEKALQKAIQYPGEDQHNAKERLKLSSDGTRINGYIITNREQTADGTLILTTEGRGQDDNRSAEVQVIYEVAADQFSIRKNVRFKSSEAYINRNEYSLRR